MAVSAVLRLVHLLAPYPFEPWYPPPYTGWTPVTLSKSPKGICFWYYPSAVKIVSLNRKKHHTPNALYLLRE